MSAGWRTLKGLRPQYSGRALGGTMTIKNLPKNDGWTDIEYKFGDDDVENARISAVLNEACHVFHCHAEGVWLSHDKDSYASELAEELRLRPSLAGRLLKTEDRVVKMLTFRALELNRETSAK
jgi:hypothetical protein